MYVKSEFLFISDFVAMINLHIMCIIQLNLKDGYEVKKNTKLQIKHISFNIYTRFHKYFPFH